MPTTAAPERPWEPMVNGPALRLARARKGLSLRQVVAAVEALGTYINRGNLSRAEHGQPGSVGFKKLPAIAQVLGIDVEELLTDHGKAIAPLEQAS